MKINCLSCGHKVDLGADYDNYEGQIKCFACHAVLEIRADHGDVRAVSNAQPRPLVEETSLRSE